MRTAILQAPHIIELTDLPRPTINSPEEVLIRVSSVGICGSEIHAYEGTHPYRIAPVVLGHEMSGVVEEVGAAVTAIRPGDRVTVDPQWTCGSCAYCKAGDINLCPSKKVLGTPAWPGAFGEFIVAPQGAVFPIPDQLSELQASLIEPLTVAVHVSHRCEIKPGSSVAILGSGSIGNMVSGVCRIRGAEKIIVADIKQHCMDVARECMGATHDILLPNPHLTESVRDITNGEGVDVAFITADDVQLVEQAVRMVHPRGIVVLIALLTNAPLQLNAYDIIGKERKIIGSSMSNSQDVEEAIQYIANGKIKPEAIVTHRLPIEEAATAMELARNKTDGAIKVNLTF